MLQLNVQIDERTIDQVRLALGDLEEHAPKALAWAINRTLKSARTSLSARVREVLNLSKKSTDSRIKLKLARWQDLSGEVRLSYEKRPGLMSFGAKGHRAGEKLGRKKGGVTYRIKRGGGVQRIPRAFIARKRGQAHENVFIRMTLGGRMVGRLPLRRLMGLSPWGAIMYRAGVLEQWFFQTEDILDKNITQGVNAVVGGFLSGRRAAQEAA